VADKSKQVVLWDLERACEFSRLRQAATDGVGVAFHPAFTFHVWRASVRVVDYVRRRGAV
jgi:hypothetical protein